MPRRQSGFTIPPAKNKNNGHSTKTLLEDSGR
jgi:hypothetical protein